MRLGVLVSGRGTNLQALIDAVGNGELPAEVRVVISNRADAAGLDRARRAGIPGFFVDPAGFPGRGEFDARLISLLREHEVDLVVLAGFLRILGKGFVDAFPLRIVNLHPSLLPAFPGLHAQRQALAHGVKVSGCTVHFVDYGLDSGPIILQAAVPVMDDDTEETLTARILEQEHRILKEAVGLIAAGRVEVRGRRVFVRQGLPHARGVKNC